MLFFSLFKTLVGKEVRAMRTSLRTLCTAAALAAAG